MLAVKESKENQLRGWENNTMQSYNEDIIEPPYFESKKFDHKCTLKVSMVMIFMDKEYDLLSDPLSTGDNITKKVVTTLEIMSRYIHTAEKNKKNLI